MSSTSRRDPGCAEGRLTAGHVRLRTRPQRPFRGFRARPSLLVVARLPRSNLPDGTYHVTARGTARTAIFLDADDRRLFLVLLQRVAVRWHWSLYAVCLMTTHAHLVLASDRADLSSGMQRLAGLYTQSYNAKYDRWGSLFGARFGARLIDDERYLERACRYVLYNPVRAGLAGHPAGWPWSFDRYGITRGAPLPGFDSRAGASAMTRRNSPRGSCAVSERST